MSIIGSNILAGASGQAGYNLTNSLRFRRSNSAYLNRTFSTPTSNYIWTWSAWVKRGSLGIDQSLFGVAAGSSGNIGSTPRGAISWDAGDTFSVFANDGASTTLSIVTTQVFRDPSAWYHIVVAVDTTQATASNRFKLYVNGIQVTSLSTATYYPQNASTVFNGTGTSKFHAIGMYANLSSFLDGYMTEINFVDGQALTPSSFGETSLTTGQWIPKAYSGSYGTNGFELNFADTSALTTSSNAGLGKDTSGNGNYWTTNNISITAGVTYDAMLDVPTNTSATVANYSTLNPLASRSVGTMQSGNLTWKKSDTAGDNYCCASTMSIPSSGTWYWEITVTDGASGANSIGIIPDTSTTQQTANTQPGATGITTNAFGYYSDGNKYTTGSATAYGNSYTTADVIGIAVDTTNGKIWWSKNGTFQASGDPAAGTNAAFTTLSGSYYAASSVRFNNNQHDYNFGQRPFSYTPPTGFVRLNTYNLPTPTILQGNTVMDATTYTGTGASLSVTNASGFKPDLVWTKARSAAIAGLVYDSVRGATKYLQTNSVGAEGTGTDSLTSFNSNGFSAGADTSTTGVNQSGTTYVGWQWQAGQGTSTSNTSGSITSTVSVSTTAGFSVVTYTGTGSAATIGHGLGVAPRMIICKARGQAENWAVYHASLGNNYAVFLNTTAAQTGPSNAYWNNTTPTSTVFSVNTATTTNAANTMVAYCWAEIAGFSKFSSYTGNGSTDGPFVFTGFRPKFVMIKVSSTTEDWYIWDTSRGTFNANTPILYADLSAAESTSAIDTLSNGFKCRTSQTLQNASGATYIYMAFAENPFKNANAR